ncbi:MAG: roadblock/LC7 domain-containing protein [Candidatus Asgardarchaeia archaeon]
MSTGLKGQIERILKDFITNANLKIAAVTSPEGFLMGSAGTSNIELEVYSAASITLGGGGKQAAKRSKLGEVKSLMLECSEGTLLLMPLKRGYLFAIPDKDAATGIVLFEMKRAMEKLNEVIETRLLEGVVDVKAAREALEELEESKFFKKIQEELRRS